MKIGVDVDEVLAGFLSAFIEYHNVEYGTSLVRGDFSSYNFEEVVGGTKEEVIGKICDFHKTSYFFGIKCIEGSQEAIGRLSLDNELSVVTARQSSVEGVTRSWIGEYFSGCFGEVHMANHYPSDGSPSRTKREICDSYGIEVLVEDSLNHALDCLTSERRVLLFDMGYPWNQAKDLPEGMVRVHSWKEVLENI